MPQIPTRRDLGRVRLDGADRPAEINPMVAYDIGRAGQAWDNAMGDVSKAFGRLAESKKKVEDDTWLAERKIETLKAEDELRRKAELEAADDGTGLETVPGQFEGIVKGQEEVPGGTPEARSKYKLWSAERGYENGKWAATNQQHRLKTSTLKRLDDRLGEVTNLAGTNPDMATEYFRAYEEEVKSQVGNSITAVDGNSRVEKARGDILRAGLSAKIKRNPMDFAKALAALETAGKAAGKDQSRLPGEGGRDDAIGKAARAAGISESMLRTLVKVESDGRADAVTGKYKGMTQLSEEEFAKYGGTPGKILDADENLKAGANKLAAQLKEFKTKHGRDATDLDLYLVHQQGAGGHAAHFKNPERLAWQNMASTAEGRKNGAAWAKKAIWGNMTPEMKRQFPGGVEEVTSRQFVGLWHMRLEQMGGPGNIAPPSQAIADGIRLKDLPGVDGSIQPSELMSLRPEDYQRLTAEIKPWIATEMQQKVQDASAALLASGAQSVITNEELALTEAVVGPKITESWRKSLDEAQDIHNITASAKQMTGVERRQHIAAIRPDMDSGAASEEERLHYERWVKTDEMINKQMRENPVAWFAFQNESGRTATQMIAGAPQGPEGTKQREKAYDTLLQLQRNEGLDQKDITLMSKDEAEKVVNTLMSAKTGNEARGIVDQLRTQYGRHFNTLWGQLQRQGGPDAFLAMPTATTSGQYAIIETYLLERNLAEGAGKDVDKGAMLRNRAGVTAKDLSAAVGSEISELVSAFDPTAFQQREAYRAAVERVTLYHMIQGGKSVSEAASKAADDVFRGAVTVERGAIIPNEALGGPISRAELRQGLGRAHKAIEPIKDQIISRIDPSRYGGTYDHSRYVNQLMANPRWVTSNDAKGVHMLDMWDGRVMVDSADGPQPLFLSWEQLRQLGSGIGGLRMPTGLYN